MCHMVHLPISKGALCVYELPAGKLKQASLNCADTPPRLTE